MEANEVQELHEHTEHAAHDPSLRPATFTMSVLAVMVALTTVLGHRSHTDAVLSQARASDEWSLYQAKKIRVNDTALAADLLSTLSLRDDQAAAKIQQGYKDHQAKWDDDLKEGQEKAHEFEAEVTLAEHRADRYDLGEALLEIGLVITSITLLTRKPAYWYLGLIFGICGLIATALGYLSH